MKKESNFEMFLPSDDQCLKNSKTSCLDDNIISSDKVINGSRKTIEKIRSTASTVMSTEMYFFSFKNRLKIIGQNVSTILPLYTHTVVS